MSHHNPRHPHRHHVRPKAPVAPPDSGYKGLFWLIVLGTAAAIGLGYCLSQPPLPPAPSAPVIQEPPVPISAPAPIEVAPPPTPAADPVKPKAEETEKRHHKADDDEPRHHKRHHRDRD